MSEDMRITAPFTEGELRHALEDEHGPATLMVRRLAHEVERLRGMYHDESITLRNELAAERARTDALVASLPKCDHCGRTATKAWERGQKRYCDTCALADQQRVPDEFKLAPDYPRAEPLRAIARARADVNPERSR